ncbi:O-acetylhomoserine sulfhydrylase [Mesobacillus boroniphilus JCM 21738]|uniref:homocysteine desulfhydrase n=1 Tax=Mesobacillus boroniphilus JCM 21738 TaxID=1294265 RepID=W4RUZ0_9BACI|nr:O-acetylhomoserine sulfhydrylase [Mesobacillus boroniphilus JCM 21738]
MANEQKSYRIETLGVHGGQSPDPVTGARAVPIYSSNAFQFENTEHAAALFALKESGYIYSRIHNPTVTALEEKVALLEGGIGALALSSGMSAITMAILNIAHAGDEIVAASNLYGGTYNLFAVTLPKYGIKVHLVDPADPENFRKAITPKTKAIYAETIGNPSLRVLDIEAVAEVAHEAGLPLIIDNTFATPYLCRPIEYAPISLSTQLPSGCWVMVQSWAGLLWMEASSIGSRLSSRVLMSRTPVTIILSIVRQSVQRHLS